MIRNRGNRGAAIAWDDDAPGDIVNAEYRVRPRRKLPSRQEFGIRDLLRELMRKTAILITKIVLGLIVIFFAFAFLYERATGNRVSIPLPSIASAFSVPLDPNRKESSIDVKSSDQALALVQVQVGQKLKIPKQEKVWSKLELRKLAETVAKGECQKGNICIPSIVLLAIMDRESTWDPTAINLEKTRIGAVVKNFEEEGSLSKALSPFSFGVMQVNWGWHKNTCKALLEEEGGDDRELYLKLFDPKANIECAYQVLAEKWKEASAVKGVSRLYEAIGCFNGRVKKSCNLDYAKDIMGNRVAKVMYEMMADRNS